MMRRVVLTTRSANEDEGESTQLMTRRLSLRTQLQTSYNIYTKGDVAKDNSRTIDIQWEAEQLLEW
jgi:hypothetical protein